MLVILCLIPDSQVTEDEFEAMFKAWKNSMSQPYDTEFDFGAFHYSSCLHYNKAKEKKKKKSTNEDDNCYKFLFIDFIIR